MAYYPYCNIFIRKFELYVQYYVQFRTHNIREGKKNLLTSKLLVKKYHC